MNESKMELAEARLKEKCGKFKCPICQKESEFRISDKTQMLDLETGKNEITIGDTVTYISAVSHICPHCGFIASFSSVVLDVE